MTTSKSGPREAAEASYPGNQSARSSGGNNHSNNNSGSRSGIVEPASTRSAAALASLGSESQAPGGNSTTTTSSQKAITGTASAQATSTSSGTMDPTRTGARQQQGQGQGAGGHPRQHQQQQQQPRYPSTAAHGQQHGGNDRVTQERPHHQSLAAQVQRDAVARQHQQQQQQQQHASLTAAANALRQHQQQQQQHSHGRAMSGHHPHPHQQQQQQHPHRPVHGHAYHPPPPQAAMHRQPQQQQPPAGMPHARYAHHHPQHQHHPHHLPMHHTTNHSTSPPQGQRQPLPQAQPQQTTRRVQVPTVTAASATRRQPTASVSASVSASTQKKPPPSSAEAHKPAASATTTTTDPKPKAAPVPTKAPVPAPPTEEKVDAPVAAVHQSEQERPQDTSSRSNSISSAPAPSASAPQPSEHRALFEEQIIQQRSVLVDRYSSFIAPSDRSLADARRRLQTAHEQVRSLRAAFTERVYGKYRVCLKPPPTSEETLQAIRQDPVAASLRLEETIHEIKVEKDFEKKEAAALNGEWNKLDPTLLGSLSADNAEQLMFVSAGLSLVILPEDKNVNPKDLEGYEDRGPINPANGQRVRNISQAAASAGIVILERTRKSAAIRHQLLQKRSSMTGTHNQDTTDAAGGGSASVDSSSKGDPSSSQQKYFSIDLLKAPIVANANASTTGAFQPGTTAGETLRKSENAAVTVVDKQQPPNEAKKVPALATTTTALKPAVPTPTEPKVTATLLPAEQPPAQAAAGMSTAPADALKLQKRIGGGKLPSANLQQLSSAKFGRSRGGAGISVNISLSLNPTADELSLDPDRPFRASTAALLARGVGTAQGISRASPQQRLKHPHPESSGGRQRASSHTSAKKELASLAHAGVHFQNAPFVHSYLNLALPPLPTTQERRDRKPLAVMDHQPGRCSDRAKKAIQSVLKHFHGSSEEDPGSSPLTKVNLLQEFQKSKENTGAEPQAAGERPIDPKLAFSVLQAIGVIGESAGGKKSDTPPSVLLDEKVTMVVGGEKRKLSLASVADLNTSWSRLGFAKRPRFTDAFRSDVKKEAGTKEGSSAAPPVVANVSPAVENLRGGGELLSDANDDTPASGVRPSGADTRNKSNHRAGNGSYNNSGNGTYSNHVSNNNIAQGARHAQSRWEDPTRQNMGVMNSHLVAGNSTFMGGNHQHVAASAQAAQRRQGQQPQQNNDAYRQQQQQQQQQSNFNAMQLAQLRQATNSMAGLQSQMNRSQGELPVSNFMGNMGNLQQSAHWSSIGGSAAAMAAAQSSLAALGLSVPMGVYNTAQDRAARALIAREQQNVAAAHAVAAHQQSMSNSGFVGGAANPGFAPTPSSMQRASRNALMNSSVHQQYGVGTQQQQQQQNSLQASRANALAASSMMAQRDNGYRRQGADAPGNSSAQAQAPMNSTTAGQKRKASNHDVENGQSQPSESAASKPAAVKKPKASVDDHGGNVAGSSESKGPAVHVAAKEAPKPQAVVHTKSAPSQVGASQEAPSVPTAASQTPQSGASSDQALGSQGGQAKPSLSGTSHPAPTAPNQASASRPHQGVDGIALLSQMAAVKVAAEAGTKTGMHFVAPVAPSSLSQDQVRLVQTGLVHEALLTSTLKGAKLGEPNKSAEIIEFLVAVGTAVPIPKSIIAASLKDHLNLSGCKNLANNTGFNIPHEIIIAVVLVWLWNNHEEDFQRAFAKSGRFDVDPTCNWLISVAVDTSVRALQQHMSGARRGNMGSSADGPSDGSNPIDVTAVMLVSRALTASCINDETDYSLSQFHSLTRFLDDCRVCALQSRSQERVLLASLISLKSTMSESFAHAYVSSMVRAGDALGHETLAELVGDDDLKISSMLPYDILRDQNGIWEDPCRPAEGYSPNLSGDVLTKGAHARAMIQKSLRRLQDRHSIKGGTPTSGAYTDPATGQSLSPASGVSISSNKSASGSTTPRTWSRRKSSSFSSSVLDGPCPSGTGSGHATNWSLYDPKHISAPLDWNPKARENNPYGSPHVRQRGGTMPQPGPVPKQKKALSVSIGIGKEIDPKGVALGRTTHEIDWRLIADKFDQVKMPSGGQSPHETVVPAAPLPNLKTSTIVSPFCRQLKSSPVASDDESDSEEDLSDEAILARHQVVLDEMKEKITAFMEARKQKQALKKNRQK